MENYEKYGSITISPTAITDKEQTYDLHKKREDGLLVDGNKPDMVIVFNEHFYSATSDDISIKEGTVTEVCKKLKNGKPVNAVIINAYANYGSYAEQPTCCTAYQVSMAGYDTRIAIRWQYTDSPTASSATIGHYCAVFRTDNGVDTVMRYAIGSQ